jgi:hypothetical protein
VIEALGLLFREYNSTFASLVAANREWETDYQYCLTPDGLPLNFAVQIDMVGLTDNFLAEAAAMSSIEVAEILRQRIFEIENSLAMYQLLERLFSRSRNPLLSKWQLLWKLLTKYFSAEHAGTFFSQQFRTCLAELRTRFGKKIALLAVTDQKYEAMRTSEFGKNNGESLSATEVRHLSGFDCFMGPDEFRRHVAKNRGSCQYLLYARTSDPVAKLKKPDLAIEHPLLGDPDMRRVIKANSLTYNIDAPDMPWQRRINDTKAYAVPMDMAFPVHSLDDVHPPEFTRHLAGKKSYDSYDGDRVTAPFADYLVAQGFDPDNIRSGNVRLRAKPMMGTYGCYGHVSGLLRDSDFRCDFRANLRKRGSYVVQPEMPVPMMVNDADKTAYTCIDRVFLAMTDGHVRWLGGLRSLMPTGSKEADNGRNHGNRDTVWAEIR